MTTALRKETPTEALTVAPRASLGELTVLIKSQWDMVREDMRPIGAWLMQIRDNKLYHPEYSSFKHYCETALPFGKRRAYQLIEAETVIEELPDGVNNCSLHEGHLRELAKVPQGKRSQILEKAELLAADAGEELTARHIEVVVLEFLTAARGVLSERRKKDEESRARDAWRGWSLATRRSFMEWVFKKGGMHKVWPDWKNKVPRAAHKF